MSFVILNFWNIFIPLIPYRVRSNLIGINPAAVWFVCVNCPSRYLYNSTGIFSIFALASALSDTGPKKSPGTGF